MASYKVVVKGERRLDQDVSNEDREKWTESRARKETNSTESGN